MTPSVAENSVFLGQGNTGAAVVLDTPHFDPIEAADKRIALQAAQKATKDKAKREAEKDRKTWEKPTPEVAAQWSKEVLDDIESIRNDASKLYAMGGSPGSPKTALDGIKQAEFENRYGQALNKAKQSKELEGRIQAAETALSLDKDGKEGKFDLEKSRENLAKLKSAAKLDDAFAIDKELEGVYLVPKIRPFNEAEFYKAQDLKMDESSSKTRDAKGKLVGGSTRKFANVYEKADAMLSDPEYQKYAAKKWDELPKEEQEKYEAIAEEKKLSGPYVAWAAERFPKVVGGEKSTSESDVYTDEAKEQWKKTGRGRMENKIYRTQAHGEPGSYRIDISTINPGDNKPATFTADDNRNYIGTPAYYFQDPDRPWIKEGVPNFKAAWSVPVADEKGRQVKYEGGKAYYEDADGNLQPVDQFEYKFSNETNRMDVELGMDPYEVLYKSDYSKVENQKNVKMPTGKEKNKGATAPAAPAKKGKPNTRGI
jgi:hypothetical protein